jgi:hypothetical protein
MLTSMKNMARVLIDLDPNPTMPDISKHISQSINRARKRRPVPALTMFQGYLFRYLGEPQPRLKGET